MTLHTNGKINLKTVADRVGLAPCSVSAVLNDTPASRTIPRETKDRIFRAARELNYRPNFWARSLRTKRTRMIEVVARDIGHSAVAKVIAAVQERLHRRDYLLVLGTLHATDAALFRDHLQQRGIEGVIAIDTALPSGTSFPSVVVDLSYLPETQSVGNGIESWLNDLGAFAAENLMAELDGTKMSTQSRIQSRTPTAQIADTSESVQP